MPSTLTSATLNSYVTRVQSGGLHEAVTIYRTLYSHGYNYAGWALGVATGTTVTGVAALDYLNDSSLLGIGGAGSVNLTSGQIDKIRVDMAIGYLQKLQEIAAENGGTVSRDVKFLETEAFHANTFILNGLSIDNWTLHIPMEIIRATQGEAAAERVWQDIASTGGDGLDATLQSIFLSYRVGMALSSSSDPAIQSMANEWMSRVPGTANFAQIERSFETVANVLVNVAPTVFSPADPVRGMDWLGDTLPQSRDAIVVNAVSQSASSTINEILTNPTAASANINDLSDIGKVLNFSPIIKSEIVARTLERTYDGWVRQIGAFVGKTWNDVQRTVQGLFKGAFDDFSLIKDLGKKLRLATEIVSPIVIDLDGNGIVANGLLDGAQFDHDGNGYAERSGWVQGQDGLLVMDRNGNGKIDNGRELFGSETLLASGSKASNGYQALTELDDNHDGHIDVQDAAYTMLRVWRDKGGDGLVSDGELSTLADAGVQSIATGYSETNLVDSQGNTTKQIGSFVRNDGGIGQTADIWFVVDTALTQVWDEQPETPAVSALPDLQGFGNVRSLHQAMLRDGAGRLEGLVQQFSATSDIAVRHELIDQILYAWADVSYISPSNRGEYMSDARQLYVLEAFTGQKYIQGYGTNAGTPNTGPVAGAYLAGVYREFADAINARLMVQTHLATFFDAIQYEFNANSGKFEPDIAVAIGLLHGMYESDAPGLLELGTVLSFNGDNGQSILEALRSEATGWGGSFGAWLAAIGDKPLIGGEGNDSLTGFALSEQLIGNGGNDTLDGGAGNDLMMGDDGNDIYVFNRGSGQDSVLDLSGDTDAVRFGPNITTDDLSFERKDYDVVIRFAGSSDTLALRNWGAGAAYRVERFEFADGTVWTAAQIQSQVANLPVIGGSGNDVLGAWDGEDTIMRGMGGNDELWGFTGNDSLDGGVGDDFVRGHSGNDSLDGGDGNDSLVGDDGDDYSDGGFGNDVITGDVGNDQLFGGDGNDHLDGGDGNDVISAGTGDDAAIGFLGDDTIDGGQGNDTLFGGAGSDTYLYRIGDGFDTIRARTADGQSGYVNVLRLGPGILPADLQLQRVAASEEDGAVSDLRINVATQGRITVEKFFYSDNTANLLNPIQRIEFDDGTVWLANDPALLGAAKWTSVGNDSIQADSLPETIYALEGDDSVLAGGGNDDVHAGAGNDTVFGESGNDTLRGNDGTDLLNGGDGDDLIDGGAGQDSMLGGAGDDSYVVDSFSDVITENASEGIDSVVSSESYVLSSNVESLELVGTHQYSVMSGTGNAGNNRLIGQNVANQLDGKAGDDTLIGYGNDTLLGGDGNDLLEDANEWGAALFNGGNGADTYVLSRGAYQRNVIDNYASDGASTTDVLRLRANADGSNPIVPSDVQLHRVDDDLIVWVGDRHRVVVTNHFAPGAQSQIDEIRFDTGEVWNAAAITAHLTPTGPTNGDDILGGTSGSDTLYALDGNDDLRASGGSDYLSGGKGSDTYHLTSISGADLVVETADDPSAYDVLGIGPGVADNDMVMLLSTDHAEANLFVGYNQTPGQPITNYVNVQGFFDTADYAGSIDEIRNTDGATYNAQTIWDRVVPYRTQTVPTANIGAGRFGNDTITGQDGYDVLLGFAGDDYLAGGGSGDSIYGHKGNDTLAGGAGNDTLNGGEGTNVYVFARGDGVDTIEARSAWAEGGAEVVRFSDGISAGDVNVFWDETSATSWQTRGPEGKTGTSVQRIRLEVNNGGGQVFLSSQYLATSSPTTLRVEFADGSVWLATEILARATIPQGTASAEALAGSGYADTLNGHQGNDTLVGGAGNDTYVFVAGDGNDRIRDTAGIDTIAFGAGVTAAQVAISQAAQGWRTFLYTTSDSVFVEPGIDGTSPIERITFADGTTWLDAEIKAHLAMGSVQDDYILGDTTADTLNGQGGADTLLGSGGDDTLTGGTGSDQLQGGTGNDVYRVNLGDGQDTLTDDAGVDSISFGEGISPIDVFIKKNTDDSLIIYYSTVQTDAIMVAAGTGGQRVLEQIRFNDGTVWSATDIEAHIAAGTPWGDAEFGSTGADVLDVLAGNDYVNALDGNDSLTGGTGSDTLEGGLGDDTYFFAPGSGRDYVYDTREGITENNVLRMTGVAASNVIVSRDAYGALYLVNRGTADVVQLSGWYGDESVGGTSENRAYRVVFDDGTSWDSSALLARLNTSVVSNTDDVWYGTAGNDTVDGLEGNDVLGGAAGNDIVRGGAGNDALAEIQGMDLLDGGDGADTAETLSSAVWIGGKANDTGYLGELGSHSLALFNAGDGEDVLELYGDNSSSAVLSLGGIVTADISIVSSSVGDLRLSFGSKGAIDLSLYQDDGASTILQIVAANSIQTYDFNSVVADWYAALAANPDLTQWAVSASLATHQLSTSTNQAYGGDLAYRYALDGNLSAITDTSITQRLGTAGFLSTRQTLSAAPIMGTAGNDSLAGTTAADTLMALAGNDTLNGGAGVDTMIGGAGNDTYVVDNTGDVVAEVSGEGTDLVQSSVTYTLSAEVENLTLTGATAINGTGNALDNVINGNSANNTLTGGAGNDTVDGGTGNDTMVGGVGNDTYVVNISTDVVTELGGEGTDIVQSSVTLTLAANVENLTLTGTTAINGTGNVLDNVLTGNSANNSLTGAAGNDTLDGGTGNDTMLGGAGNDSYFVNVTTDVVTENASEGTDTVNAAVAWTLGTNVENLVLTGTSAINGTGNTLNNVLTGNSANNSLSGGAGADTMIGGLGNDTYTVDNTGDVITELSGEGTDAVSSSVTYTLAVNVENLTLTGTTAINGTGNTLDNVLTGNSANNTLTGGAGNDTIDGGTGNDTMVGGAGNDTYVVNVSTDVVTEAANEGTDTVQSGVTLTLAANVENLTLTGTTAINGTGNTLDNWLIGNSANNSLTGAAGNDTLDGGTGNDTMLGGAGNDSYFVNVTTDVVTENASEGTDTVNAAVTWTLGTNLENLVLTGTSAINGTGNTVDNGLTGNSAANTLTGNAGNDTLDGASGNDSLVGGTGADVYRFGVGYGIDTVTENDATASVVDAVQLIGNVTQANVQFSQAGNNLEMLVTASSDKLVFQNWYLGSQYHVEQFRFTDGSTLTDSQAQALVGAMAAFSATSADGGAVAPQKQIAVVELASPLAA